MEQEPQIIQVEEEEECSGGMLVPTRPSAKSLSKRGRRSRRNLHIFYKRADNLLKDLSLHPFVPIKILDFPKHEKLLRRLGLWDFVHIDFGKSVCAHLVAQLIVSYDVSKKCSYVDGYRVNVTRAHLARALKLSLMGRKERGPCGGSGMEAAVVDLEGADLSEECGRFLEDFVLGWVVLHEEEWEMPSEVENSMELIKSGSFEKVNWASLFWFMVESELKQGVQLRSCYYASHLQCLIKSQREELLRGELLTVEELKEDELLSEPIGKVVELMEAEDVEEVKEDEEVVETAEEAGNVVEQAEEDKVKLEVEKVEEDEVVSLNELSKEEQNVTTLEQSLGQQDTEAEKKEMDEDISEKEEMKVDNITHVKGCEDGKQGHFGLVQKNNFSKPFLQPCNLGGCIGLDSKGKKRKQEVEQIEIEKDMKVQEDGNGRCSDGDDTKEEVEQVAMEEEELEETESEDDVLEVDTENEVLEVEEEDEVEEVEEEEPEKNENVGDAIGSNIAPNFDSLVEADFTGDLLERFGTCQLPLDLQGQQLPGHSSMGLFASNAETHMSMGGSSIFGSHGHKRLMDYEQDTSHLNGSYKRMRSTAEWDHKSSDFVSYMGQVQQLMEKAKIDYEEKERAFQVLDMNQKCLLNELEQRENLIRDLQKSKKEELQRKDALILRLEREINLMSTILDGYRRALKETNKAFFDYRQCCKLPEEPIYKDAGPGGLVLSVTELEKRRENKEREDRLRRSMIEHIKKAYEGHVGNFKVLLQKFEVQVEVLGTRLTSIGNEVKLLKDLAAEKRLKASETAGCVSGD